MIFSQKLFYLHYFKQFSFLSLSLTEIPWNQAEEQQDPARVEQTEQKQTSHQHHPATRHIWRLIEPRTDTKLKAAWRSNETFPREHINVETSFLFYEITKKDNREKQATDRRQIY